HVGLGDALPAADRRAVEAEPFVEGGLVERGERQRHVLPGPEQVAELEVDHPGPCLARPLERLARRRLRGRTVAVSEVVPQLQLRLRHLAPPSRTNKKAPGTPAGSLRRHCLAAAFGGGSHREDRDALRRLSNWPDCAPRACVAVEASGSLARAMLPVG